MSDHEDAQWHRKVIFFSGSLEHATANPVMGDALSFIPKGLYCYSEGRNKGRCPFWQRRDGKLPQEDGYCHFLGAGDWNDTDSLSLLWDQVKECGIHDDWTPELDE